MYHLSLFFFWSLVGISLNKVFWALVIVNVLRKRQRTKQLPVKDLPKAAILLSLRGADPSLSSCLQRLLRQDYPEYEIFIAVDSESDPAWEIVQNTISDLQAENVHVAPLRNRLSTCSLKCSSLVQMVDELDDSHEVIVLADADLESHETWLRELVAPLADPKIGATFGNRWFLPAQGWFGSLVRQLWNAPGLAVMYAIEIPWAGSLAIRSDVFNRGGLRNRWSRSIVDDGPVRMAVKEQNLKLQFVPSLVMANHEECSVQFAYNFLRRQLTWTRTYVRTWWPAMLAYSIVTQGLWTAAVLFAVLCAFQGSTEAAIFFGAGAALLPSVLLVLWFIVDSSVRCVIREQGETAPRMGLRQIIQLPIAMLVAGWVHLWASVMATFRQRVVWRGVTYEIRGPSLVRMIDDSPFDSSSAPRDSVPASHGRRRPTRPIPAKTTVSI